MNENTIICRINHCSHAASFVCWTEGHPNGDGWRSAYCHTHAEETNKLLWAGAPKPYKRIAEGPFAQAELQKLVRRGTVTAGRAA